MSSQLPYSLQEEFVISDLADILIGGGFSAKFLGKLRAVACRSYGQTNDSGNINGLPTEILVMIFNMIPEWKPLMKFVCVGWMQLLAKTPVSLRAILDYNSV